MYVLLTGGELGMYTLYVRYLIHVQPHTEVASYFPHARSEVHGHGLHCVQVPTYAAKARRVMFAVVFGSDEDFAKFFRGVAYGASTQFRVIIDRRTSVRYDVILQEMRLVDATVVVRGGNLITARHVIETRASLVGG